MKILKAWYCGDRVYIPVSLLHVSFNWGLGIGIKEVKKRKEKKTHIGVLIQRLDGDLTSLDSFVLWTLLDY